MTVMTLRGIDDETARVLKEKAKKEGISVNAVLLRILKQSLGHQKKRTAVYNDLDHLAGTWTKEDFTNFQRNIADFETVDENMW